MTATATTGKSSSTASRLRRERTSERKAATEIIQDTPALSDKLLHPPIDSIRPSPDNPRKGFDQEALDELADSIRENGVLQPILVREAGPLLYEIVSGERRWRAAKLAGLQFIPAVLLEAGGEQAARVARVVENVQRQDLAPMELADAIADLLDLGLTQTEAGKRLGMKQSRVAHILKLRDLPGEVRQILASSQRLKTAHAEALTRWSAFPAFAGLVARVANDETWTAREIADPDFDLLEERLETEHPDGDPPVLFTSVRYGDVYERANCAECPWGAFVELADARVGLMSWRYCLRPEHAEEIQEQLRAERSAPRPAADSTSVIEAARAAVHSPPTDQDGNAPSHSAETPSAPGIPSLHDLRYDTYERINSRAPSACRAGTCECLGGARDWQGDLVQICTEPTRFRSLLTQATKTRNAENKRRHVEAVSKVEDRVRAHAAVVTTRDLLLVLQHVVAHGAYRPSGTTFSEAWEEATRWLQPVKLGATTLDKPELDKLEASVPSDQLLRALVEAICRQDLAMRFHQEGGGSYGALADWYVGGGLPKRTPDDWAPPTEPDKPKAKARA